jgi:hypothetical protein
VPRRIIRLLDREGGGGERGTRERKRDQREGAAHPRGKESGLGERERRRLGDRESGLGVRLGFSFCLYTRHWYWV